MRRIKPQQEILSASHSSSNIWRILLKGKMAEVGSRAQAWKPPPVTFEHL